MHGKNMRQLILRRPSLPQILSVSRTRQRSHRRQEQLQSSSNSSSTTVSCHETTSSSSAPLLLGYEDFYVSKDGIARTVYQLDDPLSIPPSSWHNDLNQGVHSSWSVEEIHEMKRAEKSYVIREAFGDGENGGPSRHRRHTLASIRIHEVEEGIESVGTGATAWEASIVAALYFHNHPHLLYGDVLELGSGTGVGGILNLIHRNHLVRSFTFTDYESKVLRQCRRNIQTLVSDFAQQQNHGFFPPTYVENLDWYCFDPAHRERYHSVVACDCAYRHCDVEALGRALQSVLSRQDDAKIHLFGPENRAVQHEVIAFLRDDLGMQVATELVHVNRFRLRPAQQDLPSADDATATSWKRAGLDECIFSSKSVGHYLHVTASHPKTREDGEHRLSDID